MVKTLLAFCVIIALAIAAFPNLVNQFASAQYDLSDLKCANLEGRPLYLSYNITNAGSQSSTDANHTMMALSLRENETGRNVEVVTFRITINETASETRSLLTDLFNTDNGTLRLDFVHGGNGPIQIFGTRDPFVNAWTADPDGNVTIKNFPFADDKTYQMRIEVFSIDNPRNVCEENEMPKADLIFDGSGNALGNVQVVLEFGSIALFVIAASTGAIIAASRFRLK